MCHCEERSDAAVRLFFMGGLRIATGAFGTLAMTGIIFRLFGVNIYLIPAGCESRHEAWDFFWGEAKVYEITR